MRNGIFIILSALVLSACSTCKVAKLSPIQEIQYGSGGGFTGNVTTYTLKSDGTLWQQEKQISKLSCDALSSIFELAEQLPKEDFVQPGNVYSFVKIISKDATYYYAWTAGKLPDTKVTELYSKLNNK